MDNIHIGTLFEYIKIKVIIEPITQTPKNNQP